MHVIYGIETIVRNARDGLQKSMLHELVVCFGGMKR